MPHADPAKRREYRRKYYAQNREKVLAYTRQYRIDHPDRYESQQARKRRLEQQREWMQANGPQMRRKSRHGLLPEDWARMRAEQDGRCYLCGDPLPDDNRRVHIDHDHSCCPSSKSCTACRRGLACEDCNHVVGFALDDPDRLRRIADALDEAHAITRPRIAARAQQEELW